MDLRTQRQKITPGAGFTLMEVTLALTVLAGALVVLMGLQSSTIQRAVRDRNQQQAMLAARTVLSAIEVSPDKLEPQDTTDTAEHLVEKLIGAPPRDRRAEDAARVYQANLRVDELEIPVPSRDPNTPEKPLLLKQIVLTVFWGEGSANELRVVFLVPGTPK